MNFNQHLTLLILMSWPFDILGQVASNKSSSLRCSKQYCVDLNTYEQREIPNTPVKVDIDFDILQIIDVDDVKFSVTLSMFFRVRWEEPRIIGLPEKGKEGTWDTIDNKFIEELWVPDIYVYSMKSSEKQQLLTKFAGLYLVNGKNVIYSQGILFTFWCPMRFGKFPLDKQTCIFKVDINYLPEDKRTHYSRSGTPWSIAVNHYLPSGLMVIVSWISFFIAPEVVPGRMGLLVTNFLVLVNIFNSITSKSPNVSGLSAISTWVITCVLFVFGALVVFSIAFPAAFAVFNLIYWPVYLS